jgi:hypothetical protein
MQRVPGLLVLFLLSLLSACATGGPTSAPLPSFGLGDTYQFDDGSSRRVAATRGEAVAWDLNGRERLVTHRDILLPPSAESTAGVTLHRRLSGPGLFPLWPGKRVDFTAIAERIPHGRGKPQLAREEWHCTVGGSVPVSTSAGSFETIRVDCLSRSASEPSAEHTYFYAPSIGYYVRREDRIAGAAVHVTTLRRFTTGNPMLTDSALRRRVRSIQLALERDVSGRPVRWRDPASNASGSVDPVLTVRSPQLGWCRAFREQVRASGREYDMQGTACREPGGVWQVQEVTPLAVAAR